jgi:hypothetical protein
MGGSVYLKARQEWDERYADLVLGKRNSITDFELRLLASPTSIEIAELSAKAAEGTLSGSGSIALHDNYSPSAINAVFQMRWSSSTSAAKCRHMMKEHRSTRSCGYWVDICERWRRRVLLHTR